MTNASAVPTTPSATSAAIAPSARRVAGRRGDRRPAASARRRRVTEINEVCTAASAPVAALDHEARERVEGAAPIIASAPRNSPSECTRLDADDERHARAGRATCRRAWRRSIRSLGSMNGANSATNSDAGEISTAVSPLGTTCSPNVISRNGSRDRDRAEQQRAPRPRAQLGVAARASAPPPRRRMTAKSTTAASRQRSRDDHRPARSRRART